MDYQHNALTDRYFMPTTGVIINGEDMPDELLPAPRQESSRAMTLLSRVFAALAQPTLTYADLYGAALDRAVPIMPPAGSIHADSGVPKTSCLPGHTDIPQNFSAECQPQGHTHSGQNFFQECQPNSHRHFLKNFSAECQPKRHTDSVNNHRTQEDR